MNSLIRQVRIFNTFLLYVIVNLNFFKVFRNARMFNVKQFSSVETATNIVMSNDNHLPLTVLSANENAMKEAGKEVDKKFRLTVNDSVVVGYTYRSEIRVRSII